MHGCFVPIHNPVAQMKPCRNGRAEIRRSVHMKFCTCAVSIQVLRLWRAGAVLGAVLLTK